jgi:hypothetical protein
MENQKDTGVDNNAHQKPKIVMLSAANMVSVEQFFTNNNTTSGGMTDLRQFKKLFKTLSTVKQSVVLLADFATAQGCETMIKPIKVNDNTDYSQLKQKIDDINKNINLDNILKIGEVNRRIYGRAGFEKVRDDQGFIAKLVPLSSIDLQPVVEDYDLIRINYPNIKDDDGKDGYMPENIFYITMHDLDGTYLGMSDLEAIKDIAETRFNLELDMREAAEKLWAPMLLTEMDTAGMTHEEEVVAFKDFTDQLKPGRSVVYNKSIKATTASLSPDLQSLTIAVSKVDEDIIGNFSIPKALLAKEKTMNRATLEYSLKALYDGPVKSVQRYLKREIERQIYEDIIKTYDEVYNTNFYANVRIIHRFKPTPIYDINLLNMLLKYQQAGLIDTAMVYEIVGWDVNRIPVNPNLPTKKVAPAVGKGVSLPSGLDSTKPPLPDETTVIDKGVS